MLPSQDVIKWRVGSGLFMPTTKLEIVLLRTSGDIVFVNDYSQNFPDPHYVQKKVRYRLFNAWGESTLTPYKTNELKSNWPMKSVFEIPIWNIKDIDKDTRVFGPHSEVQIFQDMRTGFFISYRLINPCGDSTPLLLRNFKTEHEQFFDWHRSGVVVLPYNTADASLKKISEFGLSQDKRWFADQLHKFIMNEFSAVQKQK